MMSRRTAAYAVAAEFHRNDSTKRAALMAIMGDRLADGPAPVPLGELLHELQAMGVAEFEVIEGPPGSCPSRRNPRAVHRADQVLGRLVRDGYLVRRQPKKQTNPPPCVWDLGPRTLAAAVAA